MLYSLLQLIQCDTYCIILRVLRNCGAYIFIQFVISFHSYCVAVFLLFWLLTCVFVSYIMKLYKSMHTSFLVCALQHIFLNSNCVLFSQKLKLVHKTVSIKYIDCFACGLLYDETFVASYITGSQSEIE